MYPERGTGTQGEGTETQKRGQGPREEDKDPGGTPKNQSGGQRIRLEDREP